MPKEKTKAKVKEENSTEAASEEPQRAPQERRNSDRHSPNGDNTYKTLFLVLLAICVSFGVQYVINQKNSTETNMGIIEALEKRLMQEKQDLMQIISSFKEELNSETTKSTEEPKKTTQAPETPINEPVTAQSPKVEDLTVDEQPQILLSDKKPVVVIDMEKEIREKEEKEKAERAAAEKREAERIENERRLQETREEQERKDAKERQKRAHEDRERRKKLEAEKKAEKKPVETKPVEFKPEKQTVEFKPEKKPSEEPDVPEVIKNFKSITISEMKPKKMWIPIPGTNGGHRRVPAVEVRAGKEHRSSVKVWLYDEFMSDEECESLIKVHQSHVAKLKQKKPIICFDTIRTLRKHLQDLKRDKIAENVTPNDFIAGTMCINQTFSRQLEKWGLKWSYSTAFYPGESKFSNYFGKRIEEATQLNETHGGKFQITSYPFDIGYRAHHDCLLDSDEQRDRYATFLVYLNDLGADGGGETLFPKLGIDVKPRKGRALTWNNMNYATGKCEDASIHEANKVKGEMNSKYIIQRWYYYKNFYALGKRAQEPKLPEREPETPKVSCDEYDYGSCRLYDEWSWDHLIEYHNKKNILY